MVPLAYTIVRISGPFRLCITLLINQGAAYGLTNEALIGACFLPQGIGSMSQYRFYRNTIPLLKVIVVAAPLAGRLSDNIIIRYRKSRGGVWYPEDRLRATIPGALFLVPLTMIFTGLLIEFVPGKVGFILSLVCLFINGLGVCINPFVFLFGRL